MFVPHTFITLHRRPKTFRAELIIPTLPLEPGTLVGSYRIVAPLGVGGMGEVFRARDSRLNRDVAIKVLRPEFASDADRLQRFVREAQTLATLNHPCIAQIHGLEETGIPDAAGATQNVRALVMELVEGEDLSERLARGPMPLDEVIEVAAGRPNALTSGHLASSFTRC